MMLTFVQDNRPNKKFKIFHKNSNEAYKNQSWEKGLYKVDYILPEYGIGSLELTFVSLLNTDQVRLKRPSRVE